MFWKLLRDWTVMPEVLEKGVARGDAAREPMPGFVPLKGLSGLSDLEPPQAYADPGFAQVYNKTVLQFRRRLAFSAFVSGMSRSQLEARLEIYAMITEALFPPQGNKLERDAAC